MPANRNARISGEVRRELAEIITRESKDPRLQLVSIMETEVSRDLSHAKIYVTTMGDMTETVKALEAAKGFIRKELALRLKARKVPELHFIVDNSISYGIEMSEKIERQISLDEEAAKNRPPQEEGVYVDR